MRLRVLGSGTALPYARRGSAGYVVRLGIGESLQPGGGDGGRGFPPPPAIDVLVDAGPGTLKRAAEAAVDIFSVRHIFFTHLHIDHVGDLAAILFAKRHPGLPHNAGLTLHGPPGLRALHAGLVAAHGAWVEARGFSLTFDEIDPAVARRIEGEGFSVQPVAVVHSGKPAFGYRFEAEGKVLALSGDSGPCPALDDLGRDADLFVIECSLPDEMPLDMHLTPSEVGRIGARSAARRLLLTHIYPMLDAIDLPSIVGKHYSGPVSVAEDHLEVPV